MNAGTIVGIFTALLAVATVAVLVSQKAQTASVIQAIGQAASQSIGAAVAPVSGSSTTP